MASRDISQCVPWLQKKWFELKGLCASKGMNIRLSCTSRNCDEQSALYAQGRKTLSIVNHLRTKVNLLPITAAQNKRKVTWTLHSKHVISNTRPLSEAFDIFIQKDGVAVWDLKADVNNDNKPDYEHIAAIGRSIGLVCGADFKTPDYPHFQCPNKCPS